MSDQPTVASALSNLAGRSASAARHVVTINREMTRLRRVERAAIAYVEQARAAEDPVVDTPGFAALEQAVKP